MQAVTLAGLTDKQAEFVRHFVGTGSIGKSALAAGYGSEQAGFSAMRSAAVQRAIADYRGRLIGTEGATLAYRTLIELMGGNQPPMVRLGAAKAMFSAAGIATAAQDKQAEKPLNEMTEAELRQFIAKMDKIVAEGGEAPVITVIPDDSAPE